MEKYGFENMNCVSYNALNCLIITILIIIIVVTTAALGKYFQILHTITTIQIEYYFFENYMTSAACIFLKKLCWDIL